MKIRRFAMGVMASLMVLGAVGEGGADASRGTGQSWTKLGASTVVTKKTPAQTINASLTFNNTAYQTGGTGLRNQLGGGISINGVSGGTIAAFIYWAFITTGPAGPLQSSIKVKRVAPTASATAVLVGTMMGTGAQPCWGGDTITVFRAPIPLGVANGNGTYVVALMAGAAASVAGQDPWAYFATPSAEGASILMLYPKDNTTTYLFDTGLSGATFFANPGFGYGLGIAAVAAGQVTLWDDIGADGQHTAGPSRSATLSMSNELTTINGVAVAGPLSPYKDSDWNGNDSNPIPSLWDTTGHDITAAAPMGTAVLNVAIGNGAMVPFDCMTPVANVVSVG